MSTERPRAATGLLGAMIAGIAMNQSAAFAGEPDVSASSIEQDGPNAVQAKLHVGSGDTYLVRVEWLKSESP